MKKVKKIIKRRKRHKAWRRMFTHSLFLFLSFCFIAVGAILLWAATIPLPDFSTLGDRKVAESTKIYDRTGEVLLYDVHKDVKRTTVPFENISRYVKNATVAIEDDSFYSHIGVRPVATFRAVFIQPLRGKNIQGGSTITQQVIKNALLTSERKISRKLKEWILAIKLERELSKEDILELYLNEAPYGGSIYGIEEASRAFFGKTAEELTLAESAYIAALPKAPTYYSPYGNNREKLEERKDLVLLRMLELGFISKEEYDGAVKASVLFLGQDPFGIKAPHFVTWVKEYLVERYGEDAIENGGLEVITTLDYSLQQKAEDIVKKYGEINEEKFNANNAGMVGIDPKTGQVLVMVGSRNYFDSENEGNFNVTLAHRQPGSAFKPFVYATAFTKGYLPETVVFDLETQFSTLCDTEGKPLYGGVDTDICYLPKNYDEVFRGPVSLRNALAQSINIPAIKTLYLAGITDSIKTARKMGIGGLADADRYGLTLVLGGGEVSPIDITSAYGVFANGGVRNPYAAILSVKDNNGNILEEFTPRPYRALSEKIAAQISDILSDNEARTPAFGARSPLYFEGRNVAVKTGTTNDYKDAWTVGYTPSFALGAWVGNNDSSPMEKKVAGFIVTPMWNEFFQEVLAITPNEQFGKVEKETSDDIKPILRGEWRGNEQYFIDTISGKLATEYTPYELKEGRVVVQIHTILRWVDKYNPLGQAPSNPETDPQFLLWEKPVRDWVSSQNITEQTILDIPNTDDDIHRPEFFPIMNISSPIQGQVLNKNDKITVTIQNNGKFPLSRVDFFVNDLFIGSSKTPPYGFSFVPGELNELNEQNELKVVGYDSVLNKGEANISFVVFL